jgi:putative restriction endonuclease
VNQSFFRKTILASYNNTCCITGIQLPELIVAGHIKPWSLDEKNRLNPQNGIALNALHDRAYETGLLTITPELKIKISPSLFKQKKSQLLEDYFFRYDNQNIISPSKFLPDKEFLIYHNEVRFKK